MLDEPTANLDFGSRKYLWNLIDGVVRAGRSVLLTSHAMDECEALCSRLGAWGWIWPWLTMLSINSSFTPPLLPKP